MAYIDESGISCGVKTMEGLDYGVSLSNLRDIRARTAAAFIIFSDVSGRNGDRIAKLIKKHKIGSVQVTRAKRNPNSGNRIKVYTWSL